MPWALAAAVLPVTTGRLSCYPGLSSEEQRRIRENTPHPAHGQANAGRWNNTALKKMALQVPSRGLGPIRILHFHSRIVPGIVLGSLGLNLRHSFID